MGGFVGGHRWQKGAVGVFELCVLVAVSLPPAVGILAWVLALELAPIAQSPRLARRRSLLAVAVVVAVSACSAAFYLVSAGRALVALPVAGVGMTAAAAVFYLLRVGGGRQGGGQDDDKGGGPPTGGDDDAPPTPGGHGADWDAFERDFWAHVDRARRSSSAST